MGKTNHVVSRNKSKLLSLGVELPEEILPTTRRWVKGVVRLQHSIDPTGHGLFAIRSFRKGEVVGRFGGRLVAANAIAGYVSKVGKFGHQVHTDWYVCPEDAEEISRAGAINHSCEPNVGLSDALTLVAMKDISASEDAPSELLIDYAITGSPANGFSGCQCGMSSCRGRITRDDWLIPTLQAAYRGYFPPFKAREIEPGSVVHCALTEALDNISGPVPQGLIDKYDALLFDAVGVLISGNKAVSGAAETLARLNMNEKPYYIVTNISSGSDEAIFERLRMAGLPIPSSDRIVSAGCVARLRIQKELAEGRVVAVLGTAQAANEIFGAHPMLHSVDTVETFDTLVILDEEGFDFKREADRILSVFQRTLMNGGEMPRLIAANTDVIYPGKSQSLVFGPGIIVPMLEAGLAPYGVSRLPVEMMGKPGSAIFEECVSRSGSRRLLMVGDQIDTDVKGAKAAGLDALLVMTGLISHIELLKTIHIQDQPDYIAINLSQLLDGTHLNAACSTSEGIEDGKNSR